jgi:RNase P protein component
LGKYVRAGGTTGSENYERQAQDRFTDQVQLLHTTLLLIAGKQTTFARIKLSVSRAAEAVQRQFSARILRGAGRAKREKTLN